MASKTFKESFSRWLPVIITLAVLLANFAAKIALVRQGVEEFQIFRDEAFAAFKKDVQTNYVLYREYEARMHLICRALDRIELKLDKALSKDQGNP